MLLITAFFLPASNTIDDYAKASTSELIFIQFFHSEQKKRFHLIGLVFILTFPPISHGGNIPPMTHLDLIFSHYELIKLKCILFVCKCFLFAYILYVKQQKKEFSDFFFSFPTQFCEAIGSFKPLMRIDFVETS